MLTVTPAPLSAVPARMTPAKRSAWPRLWLIASAASRPAMVSSVGAAVVPSTMVTCWAPESPLTRPRALVAVARKAWLPSASGVAERSMLQAPLLSAVAWPAAVCAPSTYRLMVAPAGP